MRLVTVDLTTHVTGRDCCEVKMRCGSEMGAVRFFTLILWMRVLQITAHRSFTIVSDDKRSVYFHGKNDRNTAPGKTRAVRSYTAQIYARLLPQTIFVTLHLGTTVCF